MPSLTGNYWQILKSNRGMKEAQQVKTIYYAKN